MTLFDLVWHVALLTLRNFSLLILFLQLFSFYLASFLPFAAQIFVLLSLWLFPLLHSLISLIVVVQWLVQFSSVTQLCPTLCTPIIAARQASLSITNSWSLPKLMSIELVMPSSHLILCCPLLLLLPASGSFPVLGQLCEESTLHMRWSKYWSFSFSISPSNEHPGLVSFRID